MKRRFATLDVFTNRRMAGNPLAVVLQSEGLDTEAMQAIAREFNLAETVFVLPPQNGLHRARLRIFTPKRELPFAGHPTVGTAVLLALLDGGGTARDLILEEGIGPIACHVAPGESHGSATFDVPSLPNESGVPPLVEAIAPALGLSKQDIGFGNFAPACWSAGVPFAFVPLKNLDAVRRGKPEMAPFESTFVEPQAVYVFTNETTEAGRNFYSRMFAPALGIAEDPATGSAAAALAGVIARFSNLPDGDHSFTVEQGYEMGRPSLIELGLTLAAGALTKASIGGGAILVAQGKIEA